MPRYLDAATSGLSATLLDIYVYIEYVSGVPELTVPDQSAVGQSSIMDCTQSAANWEMIGATSADGIGASNYP